MVVCSFLTLFSSGILKNAPLEAIIGLALENEDLHRARQFSEVREHPGSLDQFLTGEKKSVLAWAIGKGQKPRVK